MSLLHQVGIGRTSSASATSFCAARVDGPGGEFLWVDGNQKITRGNGTYADPSPNAFSLLAGNGERGDEEGHERWHCPGSTAVCRKSCYVHGLAQYAAPTYTLYRHNSAEIRRILDDPEHALGWTEYLGDWIAANAAGGFRWHVSGDVFSLEYARWIRGVCRESPMVNHWIYTRSFDFAEPLVAASRGRGGNLALNFSCDADNYEAAREYRDRLGAFPYHPKDAPRLCYLTRDGSVPPDLRPTDVIFPDYPLRAPAGAGPNEQRETNAWWQSLTGEQRRSTCPVDFYGKSEGNRCGPCSRCLT